MIDGYLTLESQFVLYRGHNLPQSNRDRSYTYALLQYVTLKIFKEAVYPVALLGFFVTVEKHENGRPNRNDLF